MKGFILLFFSKAGCQVSVGNVFSISFPNNKCVESLKSSSAHAKLWKRDWFGSQIEHFLPSCNNFQRCLFFSHALPISLNTLTLELSLFQCVASWVPDSQAWDPEDAIPGFGRFRRLLARGIYPENFPGPHQCQDAIRQGAQRSIVTRHPRLGACWEGPQRKTLNVIVT